MVFGRAGHETHGHRIFLLAIVIAPPRSFARSFFFYPPSTPTELLQTKTYSKKRKGHPNHYRRSAQAKLKKSQTYTAIASAISCPFSHHKRHSLVTQGDYSSLMSQPSRKVLCTLPILSLYCTTLPLTLPRRTKRCTYTQYHVSAQCEHIIQHCVS